MIKIWVTQMKKTKLLAILIKNTIHEKKTLK